MPDTKPKPCPTDIELMNLAKKRVQQINVLKLHFGIFFAACVFIVVYLFFTGWSMWDILFILGWSLVVAIHGVIIRFKLSDIKVNVSKEYHRLKQLAMADNSEKEKPL